MDPTVALRSLEGRCWWVMEGCRHCVSAQLSSFCASCQAWHPLSSHIPVPGSSSPLPDGRRRGHTGLGSPGASETAGAAQGAAGAQRLSGDFREGTFLGTSATLPGWAPASSSPRPGGSGPSDRRARCALAPTVRGPASPFRCTLGSSCAPAVMAAPLARRATPRGQPKAGGRQSPGIVAPAQPQLSAFLRARLGRSTATASLR